jgi:hypothetical protein
MRTIQRSSLCLAVTALILAAVAIPAAAQTQVPFKGTIQGQQTETPLSPPNVSATITATGTGTHVGEFSLTEEMTISHATFTATGSAHFVAANGDSIDTTLVGSAEPTSTPGLFSVTEVHTITGGTGRFAGAQGSFILERLLSGATLSTSGSFHGTITSPGAAR